MCYPYRPLTHYQTLGVSPDAKHDAIRGAFRSLAVRHHPDKGGDPLLFQAIQEAGTAEAAKVAEVLRARTYDTALGTVAFDEKGDLRTANYIIWTVRDGKFVPATATP